jgi:hypothetical protein
VIILLELFKIYVLVLLFEEEYFDKELFVASQINLIFFLENFGKPGASITH